MRFLNPPMDNQLPDKCREMVTDYADQRTGIIAP